MHPFHQHLHRPIGAFAVNRSCTGCIAWLLALALASTAQAQTAPPQELEAASNVVRGRALAGKYCVACHPVPEPAQLTKTAWIHHIQPEMAKWLGIERVDYEGMADGKLIEEARLYPPSAIVPEAEWFAIWDYYRAEAPSVPLPQPPKPALQTTLKQFRARKLNPVPGVPMISMTRIHRARKQLQVADAFAGMLYTFDSSGNVLARDRFTSPVVNSMSGQRRTFLTLIGRFFPSDTREGTVLAWDDRTTGRTPQPVLENLRRPTDAVALDLNQDGREDFAVCEFGNRLGQFSWFENQGDGRYDQHVLLDRPGALAVRAIDLTRDGRTDLIVLTGQAREGVYLFINQGKGSFSMTPLIEKPPTWGFAGLELADFNQDGFVDLLTANGDNGDFALPLKAYHGIRIYLNDGKNQFVESYFYPMHGAYKALPRDFDGDGDLDLAAIAFYPDFQSAQPEGFVYLENQGGLKFRPHSPPEATAGRWMTMDAGDLDGDGDEDLALGSFVKGPTTMPVPLETREQWRTNGAAVLYLENVRR